MAVQILDKIDLKTKIFIRDREGHFIMIKVSIHQENIRKIYAPNNRAPKIHDIKTAIIEGKSRQLENNS